MNISLLFMTCSISTFIWFFCQIYLWLFPSFNISIWWLVVCHRKNIYLKGKWTHDFVLVIHPSVTSCNVHSFFLFLSLSRSGFFYSIPSMSYSIYWFFVVSFSFPIVNSRATTIRKKRTIINGLFFSPIVYTWLSLSLSSSTSIQLASQFLVVSPSCLLFHVV